MWQAIHRLWLLALFVPCLVSAIQESDVGVIDWYKPFVGVPIIQSRATAPGFYRVSGSEGTEGRLVLSATGNNVLAALNSTDGSIAWRRIFDNEDPLSLYHVSGDVVATFSGPGGSTFRTFDLASGVLQHEIFMHPPEQGHLSEPISFGKDVSFVTEDSRPWIYTLTNGHTVTKLDAKTGVKKWEWSSEDQTSSVIFAKLSVTPEAVYVLGVTKAAKADTYSLQIVSLSPSSGESTASSGVSSKIQNPFKELLVLSDGEAAPRVVWLEKGVLRSIILLPDLKNKAQSTKGSSVKELVDVGLCGYGHFVAVTTTGISHVYQARGEKDLTSIWEYKGSDASEATAPSIFSGGLNNKNVPYIARLYWSDTQQSAAVDVYQTELEGGFGMATGFSFPFDPANHGLILHIALESQNTIGWTVHNHFIVTTSTGALQFWNQTELVWNREEGLASATVAEFVELPEKVVASNPGDDQEIFIQRVIRQISDARDFPTYLINFARRFATGSYPSAAVASLDGQLFRDAFGFRQIIVVATPYGKVYGLDSSNGAILWSRILGLGWAAEVGGQVHPVKLFVVKTVLDGGHPEVALVTQRRADNGLVDTVIFHINALTGEDVSGQAQSLSHVLQGVDVIHGPAVEAYLLQDEQKIVVLFDEFLQTYIYPDNADTQKVFQSVSSKISFSVRTNTDESGLQQKLAGQKLIQDPQLGKYVGYPTWTFSLPPGEYIQNVISPSNRAPVASFGKVLGNRTTLYKYLNPRMVVVLTIAPPKGDGKHSSCGIYLVDNVKGSIVYQAAVPGTPSRPGGKACQVKVELTENWLIYHYWDGDFGVGGQTKGYMMVSVELYEGEKLDDKTESSDLSSYSPDSANVTAYERSFLFPHAITAVTTTTTKFGISSKDLIVATDNHKIQTFPRRALNPRRPNQKPTTHEMEEGLVQYDPVLPDDPKRVLSHNYDVAQIKRIITSPALLESTALVFSYGLDMFSSRVAPSGTFDVLSEDFNKVQLVFTVLGLGAAIVVTRPMVMRKKLREKWYPNGS
ncbi:DUF1620-domain-containing protein [Pluteus cervinus]|uniref:DUF1620-domain-containing protein n=1 Tax=Pluteus cervinus TaxID=181527 RepID=A0ACD3AJD2_9AGAR|nr:DUF1620-domain-containing protein [Pluteus cervinus]